MVAGRQMESTLVQVVQEIHEALPELHIATVQVAVEGTQAVQAVMQNEVQVAVEVHGAHQPVQAEQMAAVQVVDRELLEQQALQIQDLAAVVAATDVPMVGQVALVL